MKGHFYIIGAMGAGKTAVGRDLARAMQLPFHDTDLEIRERTGVDIGYIFDKEGEPGFRARESQALDSLSRGEQSVIATGGGIVTRAENCELMRSNGTIIYLQVSIEVQKHRARRGANRPLLDDENPADVLQELCRIRNPLYESLADFVVETDHRRVTDVTKEILSRLAQDSNTHPVEIQD